MRSEHDFAKNTDMIPKGVFRFKELEAWRTLENNVAVIFGIILVILISGEDALPIIWDGLVGVRWLAP